ncbi:MAG: TonB-dependent receptor [Bacteroidota bacterium]
MKTPISIILVLLLFPGVPLRAQGGASVAGRVRDSQTGEPLFAANVVLVGTSLGASTDMDGKFIIRNISTGSYTIRVSYIGYKSVQAPLECNEEESLTRDFSLEPVALEGEVVVVTAQARGQKEAINEQLASNHIVNIVSSARIQELPDANAAEAVGRLPGVSILRSGGEGNQVVVRGLQPKYNVITVDGVRMASSNPTDRSADLSMISPYSLEGIEVAKAVTADQDADVFGGTVNFKMKEAKSGREGLGFHLMGQGGYSGLSNAYNKYNNYKYVASVEGRFLEDGALGLFAQGDLERRNLTSNEFGASYVNKGESTTEYITQGLNLNNVARDRGRLNAALVSDYRLTDGKIVLSNFLSSGETDIQNRGEFLNIQNGSHNYTFASSNSSLNFVTNTLNVEHQLSLFHVDAKFSHTYSETKNPNDWTVGFQQRDQGLDALVNAADLNPRNVRATANDDTNSTFLNSLLTNSSFSRERALTASLDLEATVRIDENISSVIKFGGKYRHQTRSYFYDQSGGQGLKIQSAAFVDSLIASHFPSTARYANTTFIPVLPFMDPGFSYGKFLNGDFDFTWGDGSPRRGMSIPLSFAMLEETVRHLKSFAEVLAQRQDIAYFHDNFNSTTNDYTGFENQSAAYIMATINIGEWLSVIPGVRYQDLQTTYTASRGIQNSASIVGGAYYHYDTTVTVNHAYWLPDVILRYKPLSWCDVRMSYSNTVSYPDYVAIVPRIDVSTSGSISWNNSDLVPSRSSNYDAYLSFYDNSIGLFTAGGFLKQIDNLIYPWTFYVSGSNALKYFPPGLAGSPPSGTYSVSTYVNDPYRIDLWGLEFDWQTHFWYLPHPFEGLVLNVNYTHTFSKAQYPQTVLVTPPGSRVKVPVDSSFTDRLLYQPNNIVNLSVGYDYLGFSVRLSMLYQADIFSGPNFWPQVRTSTSAYRRWDLSLKQELPWFGLQVYGDLNNLNGAQDIIVIQAPNSVPQSQQSYGLTADLGLRWVF